MVGSRIRSAMLRAIPLLLLALTACRQEPQPAVCRVLALRDPVSISKRYECRDADGRAVRCPEKVEALPECGKGR